MKLRIEIDGDLEETEIVIKTPTLTDEIADLQRLLQESKAPRLTFYKGTGEYYLDLSEILFLKQKGARSTLITRRKPMKFVSNFMSWSPSCLVILVEFPSQRSQTSVRFTQWTSPFTGTGPFLYQTHKEVHVSRHYQSLLKENLRNMR